jgi:hypothetical protein
MSTIINGTVDAITFPDGTVQNTAATGGFATGTVMLFAQTAAPTGWTKNVSTGDNSALRVVTGTASTGGSVAFTTAFASGLSAGATTLSTAQIPSHSHFLGADGGGPFGSSAPGSSSASTYYTSASTGGGGSHTHTIPSLAVQYIDVIRATKD